MITRSALRSLVKDRSAVFQFRPYRFYLAATTISIIGAGMQFIANGWLALEMTNSNYSFALVLVADTLPGIIFQPFVGVLVDRIDRKRLLFLMDLLRMILIMSIPILWWSEKLRPEHLYLMAFLVAIGDKVFRPASIALIREIIPTDKLLEVNTTTSIATQVGSLLGAAAGGVLITLFSPISVMVFNSFTFLISAGLIWKMRKEHCPPQKSDASQTNIWHKFINDIRAGLTYTGENLRIVPPYIVMLALIATFRTLSVLVAPFSRSVLEAGAIGFGYLDAAFAAGAIIGNFILPAVLRLRGQRWLSVYGVYALAASIVAFAISPNLWMAVVVYFFVGISFQVRIFYMTIIQTWTDAEYQGRVYATFSIPINVVSVLVFLFMGYASETTSIRSLYVIQAAVVCVIAYFAHVKMFRPVMAMAD